MTGELPCVDPTELGRPNGTPRIAGVLLAAGTSSRYGAENKLLAEVAGEPVVVHALRPLLAAGLDPVLVVLGHEGERVRRTLRNQFLSFVENAAYETGQASSVRAGVAALPDDVDAAVIGLGDMPFVSKKAVETLCEAYRADTGTALAAGFEGARGNPVLFDNGHFEALGTLSADSGGKSVLLDAEDAAIVETGDPGVRRDVDRPEDRSV